MLGGVLAALVGILGDIEADCPLPAVIDGVARYQDTLGRRFDALLQVGDVARGRRLYDPDEPAETRRAAEGRVALPIMFIRGNHESLRHLQEWVGERAQATVPIGPEGVLAWIPDGTVLDFRGVRVGFCGGALAGVDAAVDAAAMDRLRAQRPVHVLVTHDGPLGLSRMPDGTPVGEAAIAAFVEEDDGPALSLFGHRHLDTGPRLHLGPAVGGTAVAGVMLTMLAPAHDPPADGSLGVLDCNTRTFWVAGREDHVVSAVRRAG